MENLADRFFGGDENFSSDFHLCFFVFKMFGMWQNGKQSWGYFIYGWTLQLFYVLGFTVFQTVHTVKSESFNNDTSESLGLMIAGFTNMAKFLNFFIKIRQLEKLFEKLTQMKRNSADLTHVRAKMITSLRLLKGMMYLQIFAGSGYIIGASVSQTLPIWIPLADSPCSPAFTLGILHLSLNTVFMMVIEPCMNLLSVMFMISAVGLLNGLKQRLENIEDSLEAEKELIECIKHHIEVKQYIGEIKKIFGPLIFVQNLSATFVMSMFSIIMATSDSFSDILNKFLWSLPLMMEIFLPCKFSTEVSEASSELMFAVYSCDWHQIRIRNKKITKILFIFMENVKKDTLISFAWMPMSLITFTSILNSTYSLFTFMRSLQE